MAVELHRSLALLTVIAAVVVGILAIGGLVTGRPLRFARDRAILAAAGLVATGALTGLLLLATTRGPHEGLHLVYAATALLAIPVARLGGGALARNRPLAIAIAALITIALVIRLYQTG
jgi:hypothetical protein